MCGPSPRYGPVERWRRPVKLPSSPSHEGKIVECAGHDRTQPHRMVRWMVTVILCGDHPAPEQL